MQVHVHARQCDDIGWGDADTEADTVMQAHVHAQTRRHTVCSPQDTRGAHIEDAPVALSGYLHTPACSRAQLPARPAAPPAGRTPGAAPPGGPPACFLKFELSGFES